MNCKNCGAPLDNDARFCGVCGTPVEAEPAAPEPVSTGGSVGGYAPDGNSGYTPGGQDSYTSGGNSSYTPGMNSSYTPGGQDSYVPGGNSGYTSGGNSGYTPGGQDSYAPGRNNSYAPGGNNGFSSGMNSNAYMPGGQGGFASNAMPNGNYSGSATNVKAIRKYFFGKRILPTVLIILGLPFLVFRGIGLIPIVVGIVLKIVFKFIPDFRGEKEVDDAWAKQLEILKQRGREKLNVIQEQVSLIDPVVLIGFGESPDESFAAAEAARKKNGAWWQRLIRFFKELVSGREYDPVEAVKIGSDGMLRSLLIEVTVFMFSDSQVLIYCGDADISTGLVYQEYTNEVFYQDIERMNFTQTVRKVFDPSKRKYTNRLREKLQLYLGGCSMSYRINTEMGNSLIDNEFMAMRNLIRDKKNAPV